MKSLPSEEEGQYVADHHCPCFHDGDSCYCVYISFVARKNSITLLQIAAGAGLAAGGFRVDFDPHIFLLLFIPPLLFLDGWRIPKDAFFSDLKPILSLAIGLVRSPLLALAGLFTGLSRRSRWPPDLRLPRSCLQRIRWPSLLSLCREVVM